MRDAIDDIFAKRSPPHTVVVAPVQEIFRVKPVVVGLFTGQSHDKSAPIWVNVGNILFAVFIVSVVV